MENDSRKKLAVLLGVLGICLVLILAICLLFFEKKQSLLEWKWREAIENGDILMAENDLEGAEASYREAISLLPERDEEPYVKLIDVYLSLEEYESAVLVADEGISRLSVCPELKNQKELAETIVSEDAGTYMPSVSLVPPKDENEEESYAYVCGEYYAAQGKAVALVTEGEGIEIYEQGGLTGEIPVPGILAPIAFNGHELLYVKQFSDGIYALCQNDRYGSEEITLSFWKNCPRPVGKVGEYYYFLYKKDSITGLYRISKENEEPDVMADYVKNATEYGESVYFTMESDEGTLLFCLSPDDTINQLAENCSYIKTADGCIYYTEGNSFYEYDPEEEDSCLLGVLPEGDVQIDAADNENAVYYVEYEKEDTKSRIYYKMDFLQGREAFLLETETDVEIYEDNGAFYLFDEYNGSLYRIEENAVLTLQAELKAGLLLDGIYDGWIYARTDSDASYTAGCFGSVR